MTASLFTCFPLLRITITEVMYTPRSSAVKLNRALTKLLRNKELWHMFMTLLLQVLKGQEGSLDM